MNFKKHKNKLRNNILNIFQLKYKKNPPFYQANKPKLPIELVDILCNISHEYKFAFFRIFKAANSTVVASLYNGQTNLKITNLENLQEVKDNFYKRPSTLSKQQLKEFNKHYFKFTFIRNPYKRIVSAYLDKVEPKGIHKHILVAKSLGKNADDSISFDEFLFYLENGGIKTNAHWARQIDLLPIPLKELNFIGRTENITNDLNFVLNEIFKSNLPIISIQEHATKLKQNNFDLDRNTKKRICKLYQEDFDVFNYLK